MNVGRPVSAVLFALGRGPMMLYNGQEVGEPALGAEGHGGDDARTTIFDYWSLPELAKWTSGHRYDGARLSAEQKALRRFYADLLSAMRDPIFQKGETIALTKLNEKNARFGRLAGETASGHWLCAFLRVSEPDKAGALIVANLHPTETINGVEVHLPPGFPTDGARLSEIALGIAPAEVAAVASGVVGPLTMPPLSARIVRFLKKP